VLLNLLGLAALAYGAVVAVMYASQEALLFPGTRLASSPVDQPRRPERLTVAARDAALHGVLHRGRGQADELLIGFGGNAQDVEHLGQDLAARYPEVDVALFHYRGYGPSTGRPSEASLLADAVLIHDRLVAGLRPRRVYALGISLGSGIAAYLSQQRPLAGAILVTPYDSIEAVAKSTYPWLPVSWLLRHRFPSVEFTAGNSTPFAIIAASEDRVIAPAHTAALRASIPNLAYDVTIAGANHVDLHDMPAFDQALREALVALRRVSGEPERRNPAGQS
jgi:hypothetical protein